MARYCVKEEYVERPAAGSMGAHPTLLIREWVYTYSDGTTERVTLRGWKK